MLHFIWRFPFRHRGTPSHHPIRRCSFGFPMVFLWFGVPPWLWKPPYHSHKSPKIGRWSVQPLTIGPLWSSHKSVDGISRTMSPAVALSFRKSDLPGTSRAFAVAPPMHRGSSVAAQNSVEETAMPQLVPQVKPRSSIQHPNYHGFITNEQH